MALLKSKLVMVTILDWLLYHGVAFNVRMSNRRKMHVIKKGMLSPRSKFNTLLRLSFTVENHELSDGIKSIDESNEKLLEMLLELKQNPFFRLYSVDMLASCEYMPQIQEECYTEACEIYPVDEEEVPSSMRDIDMEEHDFILDDWVRWDMPTEDYYDILQFPESFTNYDGSTVWRFIHDRICFSGDEEEEWKADFNKAVSGLHSLISCQVISGIEEKIKSGEDMSEDLWTDPVAEFKRRLSPSGENQQALQNLYFTYMLILKAVSEARDRLLRDCESGKIDTSSATCLKSILSFPLLDNPSISVASSKLHDHAVKDVNAVNALWEARMRTRELTRIMNCVQCNKCKLHGKISVLGMSAAFQILLGRSGMGGDPSRIHRVELAALMSLLAKFSEAVDYCTKMSSRL